MNYKKLADLRLFRWDMRERERAMKISTRAKCVECDRIFDLLDEDDAGEWAYGHDCEDK